MIKIYKDEDPQSFLDKLAKYKIMHYLVQTQNVF